MAKSLNHCTFIGNLGADPEIRSTPNAQVANFRIACTETWKDKATGQKQEKTEWISCIAWRGLADVAQKYLHKGSRVYIAGKFTTRSWDDKATGAKRYTTEIVVDDLVMLDGPGGNTGANGGAQGGTSEDAFGNEGNFAHGAPSGVQPGAAADDDLPF